MSRIIVLLVFQSLIASLGIGLINTGMAQDKIGVTLYRYDYNFIQLMCSELERNAAKHQLSVLMNNAQNSQLVQNNQVETLLEQKVKVLAVNLVDQNAWRTVIGKAIDRNVPIILFNKAPGRQALESYDHAYYIGSDPSEIAKLQAEMVAKQWKVNPQFDLNKDEKIQYALLKGENGHPDAELRTRVVSQQLEQLIPGSQMLALESAQWQTGIAKEKVSAWFATPHKEKIEVIIANNDAMAIGALEAAATQGKLGPIYGVDGIPAALNLIKMGALAGTIQNDWVSQSKAILTFSENLAKGKKVDEGTAWQLKDRVLRVPYKMIEKNDLK
ncbi:D-galactose-binding periplasmic protein [Actinobacillus ureae]|uniref:substrate-binding domain-containing protein n=1 Tax=Actinobacillus ureae TaxID=723 RepID=UPI000E125B01|nr:substrate-binding domain-containing protein [Actinobacillus ureae]SUT86194.1 D-galactose-binding periplasmic protein [Actinobacillus ureae]SUU45069.1 D-galactose-binding periplasmic protein [Actinobacillus ureae]